MATITSIVSLNQLVEWFESFADRHYFLKDFGFGEPYDIGTTRQMEFPYMWLTLDDTSIIATGTNVKSAIPDYSFRVFFMDKINIQENYLDANGFQSDNSQQILSDTIQYLQDLVTEIQQDWGQYGVMLSADINFNPVIDETQDKSTGVSASITLRTRQVNCVIPVSPTNIVVQPYSPTYETLLTCETLDECSTFSSLYNKVYGMSLFSQTGDSPTISATTTESTLIDGGVGTLSVPSNAFTIGDSFRVRMGGVISNTNNHTIRVKLKSGSVILADSGSQTLTSHSLDNWNLDIDFTIRNIGPAGTAKLMTTGSFNTTRKNNSNLTGFSFDTLNQTTFDTTTSNTLDITVQWGQNSASDLIYSRTFTLQKTY